MAIANKGPKEAKGPCSRTAPTAKRAVRKTENRARSGTDSTGRRRSTRPGRPKSRVKGAEREQCSSPEALPARAAEPPKLCEMSASAGSRRRRELPGQWRAERPNQLPRRVGLLRAAVCAWRLLVVETKAKF
jgi:hypothetical protein